MINIKQLKSDISGPIIFQGATHAQRSINLTFNDTNKVFQTIGTGKFIGLDDANNTYSLIAESDTIADIFYVRNDGIVSSKTGYWQGVNKILYINPNITVNSTFVGKNAGNNTLTGDYNTAIGDSSLYSVTSGNQNVGIGTAALRKLTTGYGNVAIGHNSLSANTTGASNIAIGTNALFTNTIGGNNVAIGPNTLLLNLDGNQNTGIGNSALSNNTNGYYNVGIGLNSLSANTTGFANTGIGHSSLQSVTNGYYNTALGYQAGDFITSGSNCTFLGNGADASNATLSNVTAIGAGAIVGASNTLVLGATNVNVAIGASTAGMKLFVTTTGTDGIGIGNGTYDLTFRPNGTSTLTEIQTTNIGFQMKSLDGYFRLARTGSAGPSLIYPGDAANSIQISGINSATPHLQINNNGQVSIGTLIPATDKLLQVKGNIRHENANLNNILFDVDSEYIQTTNNTETTLYTIPVSSGSIVTIESRINAKKLSGAGDGNNGDGNGYIRTVKAKNIGGVVTIGSIQSSFTSEDINTFGVTYTISGTNVLLRVTGSANNIVDWSCICLIHRLDTP